MKASQSIVEPDDLDDRVGRLAEEFIARLSAGEKPRAQDYADKHPELADVILRAFPALEIMGEARLQTTDDTAESKSGVLGDYQLVREVGRGGMGVVYEAQQISLDRRVALKVLPFAAVLDERQIKRFRNEARAAAQLKHPNIVQVFGVGCERSVHFYAMEFVDGQTLEQVVRDLRKLEGITGSEPPSDSLAWTISSAASTKDRSPGTANSTNSSGFSKNLSTQSAEYFRGVARIAVQVAEALDHAHQGGVIHRDIKPSNLMIDADGKPWVTDFGLARIETDAGMTMTGDMLGTLRYMSPEQTLANRVFIDHRTDIYSLGATLYELLTLQRAFPQEDKHELMRHIAFEDPPAPRERNRDVPRELETIVMTAMQKRPDDRFYATAQEMADDLRRYLGDEAIHAKPPSPMQYAMKWAKKRWKLISATAAALLLAVITALVVTETNRARLATANENQGQLLAELRKEKDKLKQAMKLLEQQNTYFLDRMQRIRSAEGNKSHHSRLIKDLLMAGKTAEAVQVAKKHFVSTIESLAAEDVHHAEQLSPLIPAWYDDNIRVANKPTLKGRRFDGTSYGIAPTLLFDGEPPITIESIATCDRHGPNDMNLLAWTTFGGLGLCTVRDVHGHRWAVWLGDNINNVKSYTKTKASQVVPIGERQHIAGVWNGKETRIYINGKLHNTEPSHAKAVKEFLTSHPMFIGADPSADYSPDEMFYGMIEAARVTRGELYTKDFTPPEELTNSEGVQAIIDLRYDEGDYAFDRSGNGNHAILINAKSVPVNE